MPQRTIVRIEKGQKSLVLATSENVALKREKIHFAESFSL